MNIWHWAKACYRMQTIDREAVGLLPRGPLDPGITCSSYRKKETSCWWYVILWLLLLSLIFVKPLTASLIEPCNKTWRSNLESRVTFFLAHSVGRAKCDLWHPTGICWCTFAQFVDMPDAVTTGNLHLYADDTTVYCIRSTVNEACNLLNNVLTSLTNGAPLTP